MPFVGSAGLQHGVFWSKFSGSATGCSNGGGIAS